MSTVNEAEEELNENYAYSNAWLVYINGLEVPVISVEVKYGVSMIPEAEIMMVPDPALQRLGAEDRLSTQIFYCDQWLEDGEPKFRLLFDGEIVGWNYVNAKYNRMISFSALDYSQILTQIFFFFMSNIDDLATGESGRSIGVDINGVHTAGLPTLFPYSLFANGVISPQGGTAAELIRRPIDYVYNLVRGLISNEVPNRSIPATSFFAPWTQRTKYHQRFVALPYLEDSENPGVFPILRAVRAEYSLKAVQLMTSQIGSSGSLWDVFDQVLRTLMMELSMLPTAAAVKSDYKTLEIQGEPAADAPVFLTNYFIKPQFLFGLPPTCNVFFPSQVNSFTYNENYATQPTRTYVNDEMLATFLQGNTMGQGLQSMVRDALTVAYPDQVHEAMLAAARSGAHNTNGKNVLLYAEEYFRGPVVRRMRAPLWFGFLRQAQGAPRDFDKKKLEEQAAYVREAMPGDSARNVYRKYAAYEHIKERYAKRYAALSLSGFNPYPVPGFPAAAFDRRSSQVDVFGYVAMVRHTLTSRDMTTNLSLSYGRTMQESFALLRQHVDAENEAIMRDYREARSRNAPTADVERVGAIAIAPPEPLMEIRDVVQNFARADSFYRHLFHRQPSFGTDNLTHGQMREVLARTGMNWETPFIPLARTTTASGLYYEPHDPKSRAAFQYPQIIQFASDSGERTTLQLTGIDATTRTKLLVILTKMKEAKATDSEVSFFNSALNTQAFQQLTPESTPENQRRLQQLVRVEEYIQTLTTSTNIAGDKEIVPRPEAEDLFQKHGAALRYNARPICSLEEYLLFLGPDATPSGYVPVGESMAAEDPRIFPAPYYKRIRTFRPGPPPQQGPVATAAGATRQMESVGPEFPNTITDWDTLLIIYRSNVLSKIGPNT